MVKPQRWFLRELKIIDPTYYIIPNEQAQAYEIVKDAEVPVTDNMGEVKWIIEPKKVDVVKHLNDEILNNLRYRKWLGRTLRIVENKYAEYEMIKRQHAEANAKEKAYANEMIAYGINEGYKYVIQDKHSVS